eukprot:1158792-Pelagomonas_calceolata.AAC.4
MLCRAPPSAVVQAAWKSRMLQQWIGSLKLNILPYSTISRGAGSVEKQSAEAIAVQASVRNSGIQSGEASGREALSAHD